MLPHDFLCKLAITFVIDLIHCSLQLRHSRLQYYNLNVLFFMLQKTEYGILNSIYEPLTINNWTQCFSFKLKLIKFPKNVL